MATETEAKLKVDSHADVRSRLQEARAERIGCVLETNLIFDDPDGTLFAGDRGLRVRSAEAIDGPDQPATLTYKGPRRPADLKTRQEVELTVSDAHAARELLIALGFVAALTYQKRRETWALGDCHVELDTVPHLGEYVEVEGPDESAVRGGLRALGLADAPLVEESYIALLVGHCRTHNLPVDRIEFPRPS